MSWFDALRVPGTLVRFDGLRYRTYSGQVPAPKSPSYYRVLRRCAGRKGRGTVLQPLWGPEYPPFAPTEFTVWERELDSLAPTYTLPTFAIVVEV